MYTAVLLIGVPLRPPDCCTVESLPPAHAIIVHEQFGRLFTRHTISHLYCTLLTSILYCTAHCLSVRNGKLTC